MPRACTALIAALALAITPVLSACSEQTQRPSDGGAASSRVCNTPSTLEKPLAELALVEHPRVGIGPCSATLPPSQPQPPNADANARTQTLPATVTSYDPQGSTSVTVRSTKRIVAFDITGAIGETLTQLGYRDSIVGRDAVASYDPDGTIPVVTGSSHTINVEAVLALEPDLVITDGTVGPLTVVRQLAEAGVPLVFVQRSASLAGAGDRAVQVAAAVGDPAAGRALADRIAADVAAATAEIAAVAPAEPAQQVRTVFLYLRGAANIYYLFGRGSGADELIGAIGARDVASEIGWVGERPMTDEALIEANPDLVIVMTEGLASVGGVDGLLEAVPALALTDAGKHLHIIDKADERVLNFGPGVAGTISSLGRAVYAPDAAG